MVNLVDVNIQQLGRSKPSSTVGADVIVLLCPATFPRHVLVRLLLSQELLLRADWAPVDFVCVSEHVVPQAVLEGEPVRALLAEVAVLQQVHVVRTHVLLHLDHPLEVLATPIASYGS